MFHCRDTLNFQRTLAGASPEAGDWPQFNRNIHVLKAASELKDLAELAPWLSSTLTSNFLHSSMTFGPWVLLQVIPSSQEGIPQSQAPLAAPTVDPQVPLSGTAAAGRGARAHSHPFGTSLASPVPQPYQH